MSYNFLFVLYTNSQRENYIFYNLFGYCITCFAVSFGLNGFCFVTFDRCSDVRVLVSNGK